MKRTKFMDLLTNGPLLADGAMGTMLHAQGIGFDLCFDELNLTKPAVVARVHSEYIKAGAQLILTNTFGSNHFKLSKHGLESKLVEINKAGVRLAKNEVKASLKNVLVAGDVGPLGVRIAPFGRVQPDEARMAFTQQIRALTQAGADLIVIETMSDLYEITEAIRAARQVSDLPVIASVTFTRDDRTVLGDTPSKVAHVIKQVGADVIGINCSGGPAQLLRLLRVMHQAVPDGLFWVKPNAGWPEQVGGRIMYPADAEYFGDYAMAFCQAGANIVGGCCGTTPGHIASMRKALDKFPDGCADSIIEFIAPVETEEHEARPQPVSQLSKKLAAGKFVIAVEMDPPRGLSTHKLIAAASMLQDAGADVVDVADSPLARMRMSAWAVCEVIQRYVGVETTLHFPTRGRNLLRVQGDLLAAHALDIQNVFVVMGDPTSIGDYPEAADNFDILPSGLIKLIKEGFNAGVDQSGASIGQPTNFFVGAALNLNPGNVDQETRNLHRKVEAGADFFLTQPIYETKTARAFLRHYQSKYHKLEKPILVGMLPLFSTRHANFLHHEVPGITIPKTLLKRMDKAGDDAVKEGIRIITELVDQIRPWASGVYIMPQFSRYDVVAEIVEAVK
jgi:methionine synthase / methylenetetrahydrofolate reductase(NADPH)